MPSMETKNIIPLFKSHYSNGKSILTLQKKKKNEDSADSIFEIATELGLKKIFLVEDSLTGLYEAINNASDLGFDLCFGWRCDIVNDLNSIEENDDKSKIIIFVLNTNGYHDLIALHNYANIVHGGSIDSKTLDRFMTENLRIAVPFYDSYIFKNTLHGTACLPQIMKFKPFFIREENDLPFDGLISSMLPKKNIVDAKSIYYKNREDFTAWLTYKCLSNYMVKGRRRTVSMPMYDHCGSKEFCVESWK